MSQNITPEDRAKVRELVKLLLEANEKVTHRAHQLDGVYQLVMDDDPSRGRILQYCFALFDEVGAGKTKQIIDAAQILFGWRKVDTMVVVAPGYARSTWAEEDPMLGEVAKHAWDIIPNVIHEYHSHYTDLDLHANSLNWIITNFEFIRREERLRDLMHQLRGRKTWLVIDESWAVKGRSSLQTKACAKLRYKRSERVTILNGTPLADGKPIDLYAQMMMLDREILGVKNFTHFRSKYCIMGGHMSKQIVEYQNLDELNERIAPYVLTRRTRDCFDLPDMLPPLLVEARLAPSTWKIYTDMRDDMVSWLGSQASVSRQTIVRGLRLAQITSGFLGGLEDIDSDDDAVIPTAPTASPFGPAPAWLRSIHEQAPTTQSQSAPGSLPFAAPVPPGGPGSVPNVGSNALAAAAGPITKELGREKLDAMMNWLGTFQPMPKKLLVWCRFKPEGNRTADEIQKLYRRVERLKGGQKPEERAAAKRLLAPDSDPLEEGAVVGNQKAGGASLNFSAANISIYLSQGPALIERTQSIGRIERPGQRNPMRIVDIVATGPKGQKTIDHHTLRALRGKEDMARWTVDQWRRILSEE